VRIFLASGRGTGVGLISVIAFASEVRMSTRLLSLLSVLLVVPAVSQQTMTNAQQRVEQRIAQKSQWHDELNTGTDPVSVDARSARIQALHHDAAELSELSASVQSDLQGLQNGLLAKDLHEKLKKMEKLSKRLRRDMEP
jgi:hypothetical protein